MKKRRKGFVLFVGNAKLRAGIKGHAPLPQIGLQRSLKALGIDIVHIPEFRSSCLHYRHELPVSNAKQLIDYTKVDKVNPNIIVEKEKIVPIHSVLRSKIFHRNSSQWFETHIQRDYNASLNMRKCTQWYFITSEWPLNYTREIKKKDCKYHPHTYDILQQIPLEYRYMKKESNEYFMNVSMNYNVSVVELSTSRENMLTLKPTIPQRKMCKNIL